MAIFYAWESINRSMENKDKKRSPLGTRIEDRLLEIGKNQPWLAQEVNISQSAISHILSGATKRPKASPEIAKALKVNLEWLLLGTGEKEVTDASNNLHKNVTSLSSRQPRIETIVPSQHKSPVYGPAAAGNPDRILLTEDFIVEYDNMPPELDGVKGGFRMIVSGSSMEPRHFDGEKVSVHPFRKVAIGQDCVIVEEPDGNALIKRFMGETETEWKFSQYNPPKELRIKKSKVRKIYAVVR